MSTTPEIRPGTVLAVDVRHHGLSYAPPVNHRLYTVSRVTSTQAVAVSEHGELRVRLSDLKVVGEDYARAAIADEAFQAKHRAEISLNLRYKNAMDATSDLLDQPMHRLKLSVVKLEALAKAWAEIKLLKD